MTASNSAARRGWAHQGPTTMLPVRSARPRPRLDSIPTPSLYIDAAEPSNVGKCVGAFGYHRPMCELLGMECNLPTDIVFSFTGFALRGGKTGPHADGWGLALYDGRYARSFLEPTPACESPMA